jgi:PIN domain nuclease of toxin-antitoxin system
MILIDTRVFVWMVSDPERLSAPARRAIEKSSDSLAVSAVCAWEVASLHRGGGLILPLAPHEFMRRALERHGVLEIPISGVVAMEAVALTASGVSPLQKILLAEAMRQQCAIVSDSAEMAQQEKVSVIW